MDRAETKQGVRRGFSILPSLFTVGTLVCGYYAILSSLQASQALVATHQAGLAALGFNNAAKAIGIAIVFDGLDGRIARLTNSTSNFGREFDSLADVITFGVAPALLAYSWGVRAVIASAGPSLGQHLQQAGWIVTFTFVICGAARLARFNIETAKPSGDRRFFVGLPIPAAAGVIAAVVHWEPRPLEGWPMACVWLGLSLLLAFLMVSRLRYYSFKAIDLERRRPYVAIIFIGVLAWAIVMYSEPVLLTVAMSYLISGIVLRIVSKFRPSPPTSEEVHAS
jgi:CDP-diacylglycerol--serine O-phosphatidyltransferase